MSASGNKVFPPSVCIHWDVSKPMGLNNALEYGCRGEANWKIVLLRGVHEIASFVAQDAAESVLSQATSSSVTWCIRMPPRD